MFMLAHVSPASVAEQPIFFQRRPCFSCGILGGSWVVVSGVISRVTRLMTHIRGLIPSLRTTHEPPSTVQRCPRVDFHSREHAKARGQDRRRTMMRNP